MNSLTALLIKPISPPIPLAYTHNPESTTMPYLQGYQGRLTVEDEAFELRAERFIVCTRDAERTDILEVAFELGGPHDGDTYSVDGKARRALDGRYISGRLPVTWEGYRGRDPGEAQIVLTRVEETPEGCEVEGEWCEYREVYPFSGFLEPFLAEP